MFYTLSYITGCLVIILSLLSFAFPSKKTTLLVKTGLDFVMAINCLFIHFATGDNLIVAGVYTNIIAGVRDILFMFRTKQKWLDDYHWPGLFSGLLIGCALLSYQSIISLIPVIASIISTITLYAYNQKITKLGAFVASSCNVLYFSLLLQSSSVLTVFSLISSIASITGTVIGLVILFRTNQEKQISQQ